MAKERRMYNFEASCGVDPENDEMSFKLTTDDVYKFLDERLGILLEKLRTTGKYNLPDSLSDFKVISIKAGKKYAPLILFLPTSLSEKEARKGKKNSNDDSVPEIYKVNENDGTQKMIYEFYQFFKMFMYTREDIDSFKSSQVRSTLGISNSLVPVLKQLSTPTIQPFGGKRGDVKSTNAILLMIDPIRVFHEMLVNKTNPNEQFKIFIDHVEKIKDSSFKYEITRKRQKKETTKVEFEKEMLRLIHGSN